MVERCWDPANVETFLRTTATEGDRKVFLSIHLPIAGFRIESATSALAAATEQDFLEALSEPRARMLALVEGEPGSGKSHLIRWLRYQWKGDVKDDHVVFIPKSKANLVATLENIASKVGEPYSKPLKELGGGPTELNETGLAREFLDNLANRCDPESVEEGRFPDQDWIKRTKLHQALRIEKVREEWRAPYEVIKNLHSGTAGETLRFTPGHIDDFVSILLAAGERNPLNFHVNRRVLVPLENERAFIRDVCRTYTDPTRQIEELRENENTPVALKIIDALDRRRGSAVQGLLGIGRSELTNAFQETRRMLAGDNKRLVLLLEDVTALQGIDDQLIEALLPSPDEEDHGDLCEIVAVMGVTPEYYSRLIGIGFLRDRINYHIKLSAAGDITSRETTFVSSPEQRAGFVASYLNGVRLGSDSLAKWSGDSATEAVPNACEACPRTAECHDVFGAVDLGRPGQGPVGLFPFTRPAIERLYTNLRDPDARRSLKTPRGIIQNILSTILLDGADALDANTFPPAQVGGHNFSTPGVSAFVAEKSLHADQDIGRRLRQILTWWGNPKAETSKEMTLDPRVLEAFELPVPNGFSTIGTGDRQDEEQRKSGGKGQEEGTESENGELAPPPGPSEHLLSDEWQAAVDSLDTWAGGGELLNEGSLNAELFQVVGSLPLQQFDVPPWWIEQVFTPGNVKLHDDRPGTQLSFLVPRSSIVQRGLASHIRLKHGYPKADEATRRLGELGEFQRWLTAEALTHVQSVRNNTQKLLGETAEAMGVRVSVAGAWLTGDANPADTLVAQWRCALGASEQAESDRCPKWRELATSWVRYRSPGLSARVIEVLRLGKTQGIRALIDASAVRTSLSALCADPATWAEVDVKALTGAVRQKLASLAEASSLFASLFTDSLSAEYDSCRRHIETLSNRLGDRLSIEDFVQRSRAELEALAEASNELLPATELQKWVSDAYDLNLIGTDALDAVDETRVQKLTTKTNDFDALRIVSQVPKSNLTLSALVVENAAQIIDHAYETAGSFLAAAGDEADLAVFTELTTGLEATVAALEAGAKGKCQ